jgi:uncharacterized protein YeaO (DUF488 family)
MIKETYLAQSKHLPSNVHKEFVIRGLSYNHILAPSIELLREAGIFDKSKPLMPWDEFKEKYILEILYNKQAVRKIDELITLAKEKVVYLICVEKPPKNCHRYILLELINARIHCKTCDSCLWWGNIGGKSWCQFDEMTLESDIHPKLAKQLKLGDFAK